MAKKEPLIFEEIDVTGELVRPMEFGRGVTQIGKCKVSFECDANDQSRGGDAVDIIISFRNDEETLRVSFDDCLTFGNLRGVLFSPRAIDAARLEFDDKREYAGVVGMLVDAYLGQTATVKVCKAEGEGLKFELVLKDQDFMTTAALAEGFEKFFSVS